MPFNQKLKGQAGILKQKIVLYGIPFQKNDLLALTGYYDKIFDKTTKQKIVIVEVMIRGARYKINVTCVNINIFQNAPALEKLIP